MAAPKPFNAVREALFGKYSPRFIRMISLVLLNKFLFHGFQNTE